MIMQIEVATPRDGSEAAGSHWYDVISIGQNSEEVIYFTYEATPTDIRVISEKSELLLRTFGAPTSLRYLRRFAKVPSPIPSKHTRSI